MIIQHNISALNAHRQLGGNNSLVSKNLEKLSSGYKINRAGDDAAGLAISEKMRAQITGLARAQSNAQDGISLVQTAEGALTEVHSMLNRMIDLSTQSANGTMKADDRQKIDDEIKALTAEIDRVSQSTNFNGINLLDGSLDSMAGGAAGGNGVKSVLVNGVLNGSEFANVAASKGAFRTDAAIGAVANASTDIGMTVSYTDADGNAKSVTIAPTSIGIGNAAATAGLLKDELMKNKEISDLFDVTVSVGTGDGEVSGLTFTAKQAGSKSAAVTGMSTTSGTTANYTAQTLTAHSDTAAGADAKGTITLTDTTHNVAGGTITIGDKTYEFATNATDEVGSGNIRVLLGANLAAATTNLTNALKQNGVKSATSAAGVITVGNLEEISVEQKGLNISGDSQGVLVNNNAATAGKFSQAIAAGANGGTKTFTLKYLDAEGKNQTATVDYISTNNADTNAKSIADALNKNDDLKKLFDIKEGTGKIDFTAKDTGSGGARVISNSTSDTTVGVVAGLTISEPKDSGKSLSFVNADIKNGDSFTVGGKTYEFVSDMNKKPVGEGNIAVVKGATDADTLKSVAALLKADGIDFSSDGNKISIADGAMQPNKGLTLQIGDTADAFNKVTVSVGDMSSKGLGIENVEVGQQGVSAEAIATIKAAINTVSTNRSAMGALQNRLEHTINNLGVTTENMTAAESRVRDVDMAKEMMQFTKNNVLTQAAQAMLAQANQQPQGVLQLLR